MKAHEAHGEEGREYKNRRIGEQCPVADITQQPACHNGCDDLGGHGEGVIQARELAHLAALAHLHNHGKAVDIDGSPGKAHQQEQVNENCWMWQHV